MENIKTPKNKKPRTHIDACPASCKIVHEMCDWKGCADKSRHFANDHVSVFSQGVR